MIPEYADEIAMKSTTTKKSTIDLPIFVEIMRMCLEKTADGDKCRVVTSDKSNTILIKYQHLGKEIIIHNVTPGVALLGEQRVISAIDKAIAIGLTSLTPETKISFYDVIVSAPIKAAYDKNYPEEKPNAKIERYIDKILYHASIDDPLNFPIKEAAARTHAIAPFGWIGEVNNMQLCLRKAEEICKQEKLKFVRPDLLNYINDYLCFKNIFSEGAPEIPIKELPTLEAAEATDDATVKIFADLGRLVQLIGTPMSMQLHRRARDLTRTNVKLSASVPTMMALVLDSALGQ
jgi:hypothetical protein